jgi:hypothetical protein
MLDSVDTISVCMQTISLKTFNLRSKRCDKYQENRKQTILIKSIVDTVPTRQYQNSSAHRLQNIIAHRAHPQNYVLLHQKDERLKTSPETILHCLQSCYATRKCFYIAACSGENSNE